MSVLDASIATGAAYLDTAIHEDPAKVCETPPWHENYEWKRRAACEKAGVTAILGVGFDPGVINAQGISYTAGVPPVAAAILIAQGTWDLGRMANVEDLDPRPFPGLLNRMGLLTRVRDGAGDRAADFG